MGVAGGKGKLDHGFWGNSTIPTEASFGARIRRTCQSHEIALETESSHTPRGIRVNAVDPGLIRTRLTQAAFDAPAVIKEYFRAIPMGRGGETHEVAKAAVFLASDWATYITGATLLVDGGQMCCKFGPWKDGEAEFVNGRWARLG